MTFSDDSCTFSSRWNFTSLCHLSVPQARRWGAVCLSFPAASRTRPPACPPASGKHLGPAPPHFPLPIWSSAFPTDLSTSCTEDFSSRLRHCFFIPTLSSCVVTPTPSRLSAPWPPRLSQKHLHFTWILLLPEFAPPPLHLWPLASNHPVSSSGLPVLQFYDCLSLSYSSS